MAQPQRIKKTDPLVTKENGYRIEFLTVPFHAVLSMHGCEIQEDGMWVDITEINMDKHADEFVTVRKKFEAQLWH